MNSLGQKCVHCRGMFDLFLNANLRSCIMSFLELFIEALPQDLIARFVTVILIVKNRKKLCPFLVDLVEDFVTPGWRVYPMLWMLLNTGCTRLFLNFKRHSTKNGWTSIFTYFLNVSNTHQFPPKNIYAISSKFFKTEIINSVQNVSFEMYRLKCLKTA